MSKVIFIYLSSREMLYTCRGRGDDPELVRDSKEQRENKKGSEPKIGRGF